MWITSAEESRRTLKVKEVKYNELGQISVDRVNYIDLSIGKVIRIEIEEYKRITDVNYNRFGVEKESRKK